MPFDCKHIRNFSIVAHIDHGKSTLADRLLENTGTVEKRQLKTQMLDDMELERQRGITIKARAVRMEYRHNGELYELNLIDTPGHVDFHYEVSRSLACCEGAVLLVDAFQGVEAQTVANAYAAINEDLEIVPVINKVDLVAKTELLKLANELNSANIFSDIFMISAQLGDGVDDLMKYLIKYMPAGPWLFPADQISDMPGRLTASEITREKLYLQLHQELPYATSVETESWKEQKDKSIRIEQIIYVERASQKAIILGKGGNRIKSLGKASREELEEIFGLRIHLFLFIKVREKWGDDPERYRDLGLDFNA